MQCKAQPDGSPSWPLVAAVGVWGVAISVGAGLLLAYQLTAGPATAAAGSWPDDSRLERGPDLTLVMAAHPHCACTHASLTELAELMARTEGQLRAHVLAVLPAGTEPDFADTGIVDRARNIGGVEVTIDVGGHEARLFGTTTSGETLVFDRSGRQRFAGGITPSRAHEGDNVGRRRILALADRQPIARNTSAVFGCALKADHD